MAARSWGMSAMPTLIPDAMNASHVGVVSGVVNTVRSASKVVFMSTSRVEVEV